jgi:predicted nucleic acid-binding protein
MRVSCLSTATMSNLVILDTSIFINHLRYGYHQDQMDLLGGLVRTSSVVLAELWCGVSKAAERGFLEALGRNHPILVPTRQNWLYSGQLLAKMREDRGFTPNKLRNLHFDVLIALTARSHGAQLITADRTDFELIASYRGVEGLSLEIW